ncbi:hypothetical protein BDQ12DRAFT_693781, partial [Crucibulum laeve]
MASSSLLLHSLSSLHSHLDGCYPTPNTEYPLPPLLHFALPSSITLVISHYVLIYIQWIALTLYRTLATLYTDADDDILTYPSPSVLPFSFLSKAILHHNPWAVLRLSSSSSPRTIHIYDIGIVT